MVNTLIDLREIKYFHITLLPITFRTTLVFSSISTVAIYKLFSFCLDGFIRDPIMLFRELEKLARIKIHKFN